MVEKRYAKMMNESDANALQEAADDVSYLTDQGLSPTEAIAKVASAAGFPLHKTQLLTFAYTNGVAAEKRASSGGPLERLASFPMPDPEEIERLVYGEPEKEAEYIPDSFVPDDSDWEPQRKTASFSSKGFLPRGMETFDTDVSQMSREEIRDLFGLTKIAESDDGEESGSETESSGKSPKGFSISRTSIRIGLIPDEDECCGEECDDVCPRSLQEMLHSRMPSMPVEMANELEEILPQLLGAKKSAMIAANAEADDAFVTLRHSLDEFGRNLDSRHLEPSFKRAGLASVNAYHPDVFSMLGPYLSEVNTHLIKESSITPLDVTIRHPWVKGAEVIHDAICRVADLTLAANRKSAEYKAMQYLYEKRAEIKASPNWASLLSNVQAYQKKDTKSADLLTGVVSSGLTLGGANVLPLITGRDQSKHKSKVRDDVLDDLDDPLHDLNLRDIAMQGMINDFETNDEILKAYNKNQLLRDYTALLHTAPKAMRDSSQARALLQQYMTQGRMAPTELKPALEMNKLAPYAESFRRDSHE